MTVSGMRISFRSEKMQGTGRIIEMGHGLRISAKRVPSEGEPVVVILRGADGVDQARILGVVSDSGREEFSIRHAADDAERERIRRALAWKD